MTVEDKLKEVEKSLCKYLRELDRIETDANEFFKYAKRKNQTVEQLADKYYLWAHETLIYHPIWVNFSKED